MIQKQNMLFKSSVSSTTIAIQDMSVNKTCQQKKLNVQICELSGDPCTRKHALKWPVLTSLLFPIGCQQSL